MVFKLVGIALNKESEPHSFCEVRFYIFIDLFFKLRNQLLNQS